MLRHRITHLLFAFAAFHFGVHAHCQVPTRGQIDAVAKLELPTDPAAVIAVVGQSPILLGDVLPKVEARIKEVLSKVNEKIPEDQLKYARVNLTRGALAQAIQNRVMREAFLLDQVGTKAAEKRAEADQMMQNKAQGLFDQSELPELKKQYQVEDLTELDRLLREKGSSLLMRRREFVDAMLGHLYMREKVEKDPSVSIAEINEYYINHLKEYQHGARARWEQLSVYFSTAGSREKAQSAIWEMGREAFFGGNMQAVARAKSHEPFAKQGGLHDWTEQGSLASDILDQQVFTLPLGEMSQIIEDSDGLHIIRVLQRDSAGVTPVAKIQDDIRTKIRETKISDSQKKLMVTMRDLVPVWSLFPEDVPGANPLKSPSPISIAEQQRTPATRR
jgi:parvulin-like peptidyl-prolyl isomerase